MARPLVLVYQEFATTSVTPETPDLNCLIVGPAYWIKDYLDDKADIQSSSDYGTLNSDNPYTPPVAFTDAITLADPPGNAIGALLDSSSVVVYFDEARVSISEDVAVGGDVTQDDNTLTGAVGTTFSTDGVQAGDYLIIQDPAGGSDDIVLRVLAVDSETSLRTTTNFTATDTGLLYRIEREVDDVEVDSSFIVITSNEIVVQGGVTTTLTGESSPRTVNYAKVYVQYRSLRQDLNYVQTASSETEVLTDIGKNDARNPLGGAVVTALANTTTPVQYFGVQSNDTTGHNECLEIIEGREDIYAQVPLTESSTIIALYKVATESLASVTTAEATGVPQKFRVVIGAQDLPTTSVISGPYTDGSHQTVSGAIAGGPAAADDINVFADPSATFVTDGVRAADTLVIVSDTAGTTRVGSYTVAEVYGETRLRTTTVIPGTDGMAGDVQYYIIRGTGSPETTLPGSFTDDGVTASTTPATVTTNIDRSLGAVDEYEGKIYRGTGAQTGDWLITASTAANPAVLTVVPATITNQTDVSGGFYNPISAVTVARQATSRRCFRVLLDNTATFQTDNVTATDLLQIPNPIAGTNYTATYDYTVAYIPNENLIVLAANTDMEAVDEEAGDTTLNYRISRTLSKDDQVDALVTIAQSFNSRRVILVWPNSVLVAGLVDGSKVRSVATTAEAADAQPGYYLGAVIGGMTAGLPSHQGFTNLGVAGIDQIYNSTRYFSDTQLTELSDGGWFVFAQDNPSALPYCIHQLTTDPDTLETGEYSVVKNFDFISLFFMDILDDFLGIWNINEETLGFLRESLENGIDLLRLRKYARIGAPLNDAAITSVAESTASADRVEVYMNVDLPKPLNRIGLHLISV